MSHVVHVLAAVERGREGQVGAEIVRCHVVVVADFVLRRVAERVIERRGQRVSEPGQAAIERIGVFQDRKVLVGFTPVSFQIASIRPFGATDIVPNH